MKLGFSTSCIKNRDILKAIQKAKELSCDLVQFSINMQKDGFPDNILIEKVKEVKENIEIVLHPIDKIPFTENQIKQFIELAKKLYSKIIIIHVFRETNLDLITKLKEICEKNNITLAVENSVSKELHRISLDEFYAVAEFQEIINKIPDMKIVLDVVHAQESGISPVKFYSKLKESIIALHISDYGENGYHMPVGMGEIDFKTFFKNICNHGKNSEVAYIIIEIKEQYEDKLEDSIKRVRQLAKA